MIGLMPRSESLHAAMEYNHAGGIGAGEATEKLVAFGLTDGRKFQGHGRTAWISVSD